MMYNTLPKDTSSMVSKTHWFSKQWWKLDARMIYRADDSRIWEVEEGFVHDYASIPRPLWPILTPTGPYGVPAIFHDKFLNDKLFLEMLLKSKTPKWLAHLMFTVVAHPVKEVADITKPKNNSILGG